MKNFQSFSSILRTQTSKTAMWGGKYQFTVSELPLQNSEIKTYLIKGNLIQKYYKIIYKHININIYNI